MSRAHSEPQGERDWDVPSGSADVSSSGDAVAGDGIFSSTLPVDLAGTYRARIIAQYDSGEGEARRELLAAYTFDGKRVITVPQREPPRLRDRY